MKFIYAAAFTLLLVELAQATVFQDKYLRDVNHPGKCVIANTIINPGESVRHPTEDCAEITCKNYIGLVTIESCDPLSDDVFREDGGWCKWGDLWNIKAPFPECCKRSYSCVL